MFSWFKFDWLKSKPEPVEVLSSSVTTSTTDNTVRWKVYKNILYSNGIVTVVMNDGTVLSKVGDSNLVSLIKACVKEEEIYNCMLDKVQKGEPEPEKEEDKEEKNMANKGIQFLAGHNDFIVNGDKAYLKGVKLELPPVIIATFAEIIANMEEESSAESFHEWDRYFTALKMFWLQLALNPLEQSREDLLTFVKKNDVKITPNGNLVLYRKVVKIGTDNKEFTAFVSKEYFRIKKWKKSPKNYLIREINLGPVPEYDLVPLSYDFEYDQTSRGTLYDAYHTISEAEDNTFTSWHNSGRHTIKVGTIYSIPDKDINLNNGLCAAGGLHAAAVDYDYSGFGDTPVVVLVNPSKAITVPKNETGKLRTTEMFIAAINDKPLGVHWDDDDLVAVDEEYHQYTLLELEEILATMSFEKLVIEDNLPEVSMADVLTISEMLRNRVQPVTV
jgi:hypothetical protein